MSTINPINSSNYYQLSNQSKSAGNSSSDSSSGLASILQQLESPSAETSTGDDAFSLNLSDYAQNLLGGSSDSTSSPISSDSTATYTLTKAQKKQITNILEKYKDAPLTQDTYNKIQDELTKAGLSPAQLANRAKIEKFNPTQTLIDALNGTDSSADIDDNATDQTKSDNFMQSIITQWKSVSTAIPATNAPATGSNLSIDA